MSGRNQRSDGPAPEESDGSGSEHSEAGTDEEATRDADADQARSEDASDLDLAARAEVLAEENERLRAEYARARKSEYRRTAIGLAAVGALAILGGILFSDGREVLFAFGLTGLFGAVLTLYLTPTAVVAADVGERVYAAMAANDTAIATQLGVDDDRVYVPGTERPAYLYVPRGEEYEIPDREEAPIVVAEEGRGLYLEATGAYLFEEFERALTGELAGEASALGTQLSDGAVEQFELASAIDFDAEEAGRVTFRVSESAFGALDRFDHPLASFLAVGLAAGLDVPVTLEVEEAEEYADWLITCRWNAET